MGSLDTTSLDAMATHLCQSLSINTVDVFDYGASDGPVAVVAGGGDQPEILDEARKLGCTTYITGTVVHRWKRESIQSMNREFHQLARQWKINLIGASHYHTEKCAVEDIALFLEQQGLYSEFLEDPVLENYTMGNWRYEKN